MADILLVAPYWGFADRFREVFTSHREVVGSENEHPEEHRLEIMVEFEHASIYALRPSCDILIARGFSAEILRSKSQVPVVEIPILPHDIIRCLRRSIELYGRRPIVFPATRIMTAAATDLSNLLEIDLRVVTMATNTRDATEAAFVGISDPECVVIGGQNVCSEAGRLGFKNLVIESGPESMYVAISEAKRLAFVRRREREKTQSFKTILDSSADGILALDRQNRLTSINAMAAKILNVEASSILGYNLSECLPGNRFCEFLATAPDCSDEVARLNGIPLAVNKSGIFLNGERIGSLVTLQYVSKIQSSEKKIRGKIIERGLVARHTFANIYGKSPSLRAAMQSAYKYSQANASVLIVGGNGTGKELFAQSIHNASMRHRQPFVAINCAAIPDSLLESELFGYTEGAFTGASKGGKLGLIELAHEGTLFLDEIGEMSPRLQARLLRVLQEKEIMRLGGDKVTRVDIRVISATNRDLLELVEKEKFREDLYFRLAVLTLRLPSLDERREDIPGLAATFLASHRPNLSLEPEAMALLCELHWRGNIRELSNACEQIAILSESTRISLDELRVLLAEKIASQANALDQPHSENNPAITVDRVETLIAQGHSKQHIARLLGVNRTTLWRKMRTWGMLQ